MAVAAKVTDLTLETLKLELSEDILTIKISRPKVLNALSNQVISELRSVFSFLDDALGKQDSAGVPDWSIRGVILTGDGDKAFVAGADITEMHGKTPDEIRQYVGDAQEVTLWMENLAVPVVAAVNGFALGGGTEIALACDFIFASENAFFGQPEVALGLIPGFGGTVRLQKRVGPALAADLILSGRRIDAKEAKEIGLVNRVFDSVADLQAGSNDYFKTVKAQSPIAVAEAKKTIRQVAHISTADGLAVELDAFARCFATEDMQEGTGAFIEKRKPNFSGK